MEMGCYGIGVTRVVAAAIEQNHDERGIIWPDPMAPFLVAVIPMGYRKSEAVKQAADEIHAALEAAGIEVLLDDRDERPGVLLADQELIGIPHRIVVGDRGLKEGVVEYQHRRDAAATKVAVAGAVKHVRERIGAGDGSVASQPSRPRSPLAAAGTAHAGAQQYELLSASIRATLAQAVNDRATVDMADMDTRAWVRAMTPRVAARFADEDTARRFLALVRYEALRAGLDPQLVLALIDVESQFRKYAVSRAGARGLMQVMPFWMKELGGPGAGPVSRAHQPALRLHDPALLPRPRARQPLQRARALQRIARAGRLPRPRAARVEGALGALGVVGAALARGELEHAPVDAPRAVVGHAALGVVDARDRERHLAAELALDRVVADHERVREAVLGGEALHRVRVRRVHRHADHHDVGMGARERRELGNFLHARHAPRRPEIHHHPLALVVGEAMVVALRVDDVEPGGLGGAGPGDEQCGEEPGEERVHEVVSWVAFASRLLESVASGRSRPARISRAARSKSGEISAHSSGRMPPSGATAAS